MKGRRGNSEPGKTETDRENGKKNKTGTGSWEAGKPAKPEIANGRGNRSRGGTLTSKKNMSLASDG